MTLNIPLNISEKHDGGSVIAWAYMAANRTGSLVFNDDVNAGKQAAGRILKRFRQYSAHIPPNVSEPIGRCFTLQMDNDANTTKEFFKAKKWSSAMAKSIT